MRPTRLTRPTKLTRPTRPMLPRWPIRPLRPLMPSLTILTRLTRPMRSARQLRPTILTRRSSSMKPKMSMKSTKPIKPIRLTKPMKLTRPVCPLRCPCWKSMRPVCSLCCRCCSHSPSQNIPQSSQTVKESFEIYNNQLGGLTGGCLSPRSLMIQFYCRSENVFKNIWSNNCSHRSQCINQLEKVVANDGWSNLMINSDLGSRSPSNKCNNQMMS